VAKREADGVTGFTAQPSQMFFFWTSHGQQKAHAQRPRYNWRMDNATSNTSSSSAGFLADIFRLIPRNKRAAFGEMLAHELRGRELPDHELHRITERAWHQFSSSTAGQPKSGIARQYIRTMTARDRLLKTSKPARTAISSMLSTEIPTSTKTLSFIEIEGPSLGSFDEGQRPSHGFRCGHQYDRGCEHQTQQTE
jgi:hypothetical protein